MRFLNCGKSGKAILKRASLPCINCPLMHYMCHRQGYGLQCRAESQRPDQTSRPHKSTTHETRHHGQESGKAWTSMSAVVKLD